MAVNSRADELRYLMTWNVVPQASAQIGMDMGQLLKFVQRKLDPTDEQLNLMAEYLIAKTGLSIEEQLAKRDRESLPPPAAPIPKNDPRIFGDNSKAGIGRPKGSGNNLTRHMRELIYQAADLCGEDGRGKGGALGYLTMLAKTNKELFNPFFLRLVPQATHLEAEVSVVAGGGVNIVPIKSATFFSPEEVARALQQDEDGTVIEGEAVEIKKKVEEGK